MATSPDRQPGPGRGLAIAVIVVGLLLGAAPAYKVISTGVKTLVSPATVRVPGETRLHLKPANYVLFQRTGTTTGGGGISFTTDNGVSIGPEMVSVTSTSGDQLAVKIPGGTETITRGSSRYTGAVEFKVTAEGDYVVRVEAPRQPDALVTRSIGDTLHSLLGWIGLGAIAGLVLVAGVVLLIVGEVRRNRARRPPPPPPPWLPPQPPQQPPAPA